MTTQKKQYDIFISYRRSDGLATARLIYDRLEQAGYNVSFDIETLRSGNFNTQLYERIEKCKDVIVIVSPDALKFRDNPEDDWLRLEIAHALKQNKNIIPVFLRDVIIPKKSDLPVDIAELVMKNGITASYEHFDSTLNKLCSLLTARKRSGKKWFYTAVVVFILLILGILGCFWRNSENMIESNPVFPEIHEPDMRPFRVQNDAAWPPRIRKREMNVPDNSHRSSAEKLNQIIRERVERQIKQEISETFEDVSEESEE